MNLLHAWKSLIESGRSLDEPLCVSDVDRAIRDLTVHARERGLLRTAHPWELDPAECRELHERFGYTPAGTWARLAGLAAGADILQATSGGFVCVAPISATFEGLETRLVESFTRRLIPPAAAAALYIALEVHPMWGLRLGREVGVSPAYPNDDYDPRVMQRVEEIVFGTISALLAALRGLPNDRRYPLDALGDVLFHATSGARTIVTPPTHPEFPPAYQEPPAPEERRVVTTSMAIADLFDHVLVRAQIDGSEYWLDGTLPPVAAPSATPRGRTWISTPLPKSPSRVRWPPTTWTSTTSESFRKQAVWPIPEVSTGSTWPRATSRPRRN